MSKYIELAKKLKALAEKGIGGEKENAQRMLEKLMRERNLSMDAIEAELNIDFEFKVSKAHERLFAQVAATVVGKGRFKLFGIKGKRDVLVVVCTPIEAIEIDAKFSFYKNEHDRQLDIFFMAFVKANDLYPSDGGTANAATLSDEEMKKYEQARRMANSIVKSHYRKQIEG